MIVLIAETLITWGVCVGYILKWCAFHSALWRRHIPNMGFLFTVMSDQKKGNCISNYQQKGYCRLNLLFCIDQEKSLLSCLYSLMRTYWNHGISVCLYLRDVCNLHIYYYMDQEGKVRWKINLVLVDGRRRHVSSKICRFIFLMLMTQVAQAVSSLASAARRWTLRRWWWWTRGVSADEQWANWWRKVPHEPRRSTVTRWTLCRKLGQ